MAIINEISGKEGDAQNFLIACMDAMEAEVDVAEMLKPHMEYMKEFIDSFAPNEINPILQRVTKVRTATPNPSIAATKAQNTADYQAGTRKPETIKFTAWPSVFKNPIMIRKMFGSVPTGTKSKRGISKAGHSKLKGKIAVASTDIDMLYLLEYMLKFFILAKDDSDCYVAYSSFLDRCKELGYTPKPRNLCFSVKTQEGIAKDLVGLFLYEDMLDANNQEYLRNCLDRYYEIYGV